MNAFVTFGSLTTQKWRHEHQKCDNKTKQHRTLHLHGHDFISWTMSCFSWMTHKNKGVRLCLKHGLCHYSIQPLDYLFDAKQTTKLRK